MREKSLKFLTKPIILMLIVLGGCSYVDRRPSPLTSNQYPYQYNTNNSISYEQHLNNTTKTIPSTYENQNTQHIDEKNTPSTSTPTQIQNNNTEDVILEEIVYIPSALQTTPVSEIEILSETNIPEEIPTSQPKQETKTPEIKKVKVKAGDTLYSIAKQNDIKVYDLAEYNNIKSPFTVKLGQIIKIPTDTKTTTKEEPIIMENLSNEKTFIEEPKNDFHIVKKGDTVYSIAKKNNVPLKDLILRNNLKAPYKLAIGDKIYIPNTAFHIVNAKDTAYSISRKYNVNLNSLVKLNKLSAPYTLTIGQKLLLPATNVDIQQKQINYIVKDTDTSKIVKPSSKESSKELTQAKVVKKEKVKIKQTTSTQQTEKQKQQQEKIQQIISKPAPLTSKTFKWPVKGKVISKYGIKNNGKRNDGINISAKLGTNVVAAENGIIAYAGNELKGLGNLIIIKHDKDYMTVYAHNDTITVKKGQSVKRGDKIATVGKTGRVTTPQLHFEVRKKTQSIDPSDILE